MKHKTPPFKLSIALILWLPLFVSIKIWYTHKTMGIIDIRTEKIIKDFLSKENQLRKNIITQPILKDVFKGILVLCSRCMWCVIFKLCFSPNSTYSPLPPQRSDYKKNQ